MKRSVLKKTIWIIIGCILVGVGAAITMKANIGIGAYDSVAKSISDATGFEVGTMGIMTNCLCVVGSFIILKKEFGIKNLLQVPFSILLGSVINFVYYQLLTFTFDSFILGIILDVIGLIIVALGVSVVMIVDEITFALEGFCAALTRLIPISFAKMRQMADVISVLISIGLKFILDLPWSIGLGTIIGVIIFGPSIGLFMKKLKPMIK